MLQESLVVFAVALVGGVLPLVGKRSDRLLHLFIAFATGSFLGVVFLHLLPEVAAMAAEVTPGEGSATMPWLFVLLGVVVVYLLEKLLLNGSEESEHHQHATVGYASLLGLCIHAFTSGMSLAAASQRPELADSLFLSVASHKIAESFSLATVFLLAGFSSRRTLATMVMFALVTPAGMLAGDRMAHALSQEGLAILTALAAGTFLFVALCDLLPEVFHHRVDALAKVVLLAAGIALGLFLPELGS